MSKSIDSNKQFMVGNGILAFGVFFIVCMFLYLGFRFQRNPNAKVATFKDTYSIQISDAFANDSLNIYINDSLLLSRRFSKNTVKFQVKRFAEQSVLFVVQTETDETTPYNLNDEGSKITVGKKGNKVFIEEIVESK